MVDGADSLILSVRKELAEREGFEPPVPFGITGFQDQRLKPLGHLSISEPAKNIIAGFFCRVNRFFESFSKIFFWRQKQRIIWQKNTENAIINNKYAKPETFVERTDVLLCPFMLCHNPKLFILRTKVILAIF